MARCPHLEYDGGSVFSSSESDCYKCDLCGKTWDWNDAFVETICKCENEDEYRKCQIWKKYS